MSKIRKSARGQDCTLMLFPHCEMNTETVVLAHLPSSFKGIGLKSPDWWGVYACRSCHDVLDGRQKTEIEPKELAVLAQNALFRTWAKHIDEGRIQIL